MAAITDPPVLRLLEQRNHAVISTQNPDGSIHRPLLEGADQHIDRLAKKYLDADSYPYRQPGEQRVSFLVTPTLVRHQKQ